MRFVKLVVLAALAIALRPAGAAGQERSPGEGAAAPSSRALSAPMDHRLLVGGPQVRATLASAGRSRVELRAEDWSVYDLVEYMAWGMVPGLVIGAVVGGATSDGGLDGMAGVFVGSIIGAGVGMAAGGIVYVVTRR
ncbi:MAG: hypothetical protein KY467_10110 [Gemmatimonadetes bacterium]|nr:hypothetical protein [Gemmatimonadota bacterium]